MRDEHTGLTSEQVEQALRDANGVKAHAAKALGVPRSTFRGVLDRLAIETSVGAGKLVIETATVREVEPAQYAQMRRRLIAAEQRAADLHTENKALADGANVVAGAREVLRPLLDQARLAPPDHEPPTLGREQDEPVELLLHLCDWHLGEIVRAEQVNGLNEYSPAVAVRRLTHVVDVASKLARMYADEHGIGKIIVLANGDLVSGQHQLHPDSADEAARIVTQAFDAGLLLAQVARDLSALGPVEVHMTGSDNHSRSTRRAPTGKAAADTSWGQVVGEYAAALARDVPGVEWILARGYRHEFTVAGHSIAAMHGHMMKGGGGQLGIPAYALKRMATSTVGRGVARARQRSQDATRLEEMARIARHLRIAHFHTFTTWQIDDGTVTIAPSLKGSDNFSIDALERWSPAGQLLEVFHPAHDLLAQHFIDAQTGVPDEARYRLGALTDERPAYAAAGWDELAIG